MVYGVPAKHKGWVSIAGNKLNFDENNIAEDSFDNSKYKLSNNTVKQILNMKIPFIDLQSQYKSGKMKLI